MKQLTTPRRSVPGATDESIQGGPGRNNKAPWTRRPWEQRSSQGDGQEHQEDHADM